MDLVLSVMSIVISTLALIMSSIGTKKSNDIQKSQVELQIRESITNARKSFEEKSQQLEQHIDEDIYIQVVNSAFEDYLNAYDDACGKYIDRKVNRKRFKNTYFSEIRRIVECEKFKDKYVEPQTKYQATVKVYNKWYKH